MYSEVQLQQQTLCLWDFERSFLPLLEYDDQGRKVILMRPGCFDPFAYKAELVEKANLMVAETMCFTDIGLLYNGIIVIIDFEGYTLGHMTQRPVSFTKKHLRYLQVGCFLHLMFSIARHLFRK